MNERIRQLAGQALDKVVPYTWTRLDYNEIQRLQEYFAELIVQECIGIVEKQKAKMSYGPTFVIEDIKQHFGVEE